MKDLLVLCYPTFGKNNVIQLNSKSDKIVLAPDEFNNYFKKFNLNFDVVSITKEKIILPLMDSGIVPKTLDDIDIKNYKFIWHMFRDPTQPEVLEILKNLDFSNSIIINNIDYIKNLFKDNYYEVLNEFNLSPQVYKNIGFSDISWEYHNFGTLISKNKKYISSYSYNNNRGDYTEREQRKKIIAEYIDNVDGNGNRSFFRIGYSFNKITSGWIYYGTEFSLKSGNCKIKIPYSISEKYVGDITKAMNRLGVDVCHLEGNIKNDMLTIFDINPYPTASGNTLSSITEEISKNIVERIKNET